MTKVILADQAHVDIDGACRWWAEHRSAEQAERWYDRCLAELSALSNNARRCPLAAENDELPFEARQRTFGLGRRPTHRIVFTIRPDMIYVLRVQHLAQSGLTIEDLIGPA